MKKAPILLILLISLSFVGCRKSGVTVIDRTDLPKDIYGAKSPAPTLGLERTLILFFVKDDSLEPIERSTREPGSARTAVKMLLEGPSPEEQVLGLSSSIPPGVELLSVRESSNGVASLDLTSEFEAEAEERIHLLRVAQVVFSVTAVKGIDRVLFLIDGEPSGVLIQDATVVNRPVGRSDYSSLLSGS